MGKACIINFVLITADTILLSASFKSDIVKATADIDSPFGFAYIVLFVLCAFFFILNSGLNFISWQGLLKYDTGDKFSIKNVLFNKGDAIVCNIIKIFGWILIISTLGWTAFSAINNLLYHFFTGIILIPIFVIHTIAYSLFLNAKSNID